MGETSSSNGLTHWLLLIVFEFWEIRIIDYESLIDYESFFVLNSPNILALCERNLDDSGNFTVRGCFPLIWKDSTTLWSCTLFEERTSFCMGLISRKLCGFVCFWLALLHSVSYFFFLYWLPSSFLCTVFDSIFFYQNDIHKFTNNIYDIKTIKIKET